ncbi:MAG: YbaN family protein [Erysipelotrichaceae bacterium]|nr:YbaN family protein [Erysipelotrichaceae bacterium]
MKNNKLIRIIYASLGIVAVGIGTIGIFLPILPTTPFILVAIFFFMNSSTKLNNWFKQTKLYQTHLNTYVKNKTMKLKTKLKALTYITIIMMLSCFFMIKSYLNKGSIPALIGVIVMIIIWLGHIIYFIFIIKTDQ